MPEQLSLAAPENTEALGRQLATALCAVQPGAFCVYLHGELGAGKTSLARSLLRGLGHAGRVPSPTYTLVEPYTCGHYRVYHMDLYRLQSPGELEYLGVSELATAGSILLVEWPEHGAGELIPADLEIFLQVISEGRACVIEARSEPGSAVLERIMSNRGSS